MLTSPPPTLAALAQRREAYVQWLCEHFGSLEPKMHAADGRRWALNHVRLFLGVDLNEANAYFTAFALTKDSDIGFIRFLKTLLDERAAPRLPAAARSHLVATLTGWPVKPISTVAKWPCHHTENHDLMHLTIRLFALRFLDEDVTEQEQQIHQALAWRFERGWVEWNSACYQFHYSNPLILLADHAPGEALRRCAGDLLNVLLAERVVLGVNGYLGGPSFRCRTADVNNSPTARKVAYLSDGRYDAFLPTVWVALGLGEPRFDFDQTREPGLEPANTEYASGNEPRLKQDEGLFFACSRFVPHPLISVLAGESATRPAFSYEGQRFIGWPGPEQGEMLWATQRWIPAALHYHNTPHVSLGSVHSDGWVCQARYNKVLFAAEPSQGLRVETILPGVPPHKRRYEARGRCVQHGSWFLGQGTLFEDGGIRAHRVGEWNLYRVGQGLCAHWPLADDYHVLQVSDLEQWGSEEAFVGALTVPKREGDQVRGVTLAGDEVAVNLWDMSLAVNGIPRPHPPAMLHDCPYLQAVYGSGRITIRTSQGEVTFTPGP